MQVISIASRVTTSAHEEPHVDTHYCCSGCSLGAASFGATPAACVAQSQLCGEAVLSDRSAWLTQWVPRVPGCPRVTSSAMRSRRLCGIGPPKPASAARAASGPCSHANPQACRRRLWTESSSDRAAGGTVGDGSIRRLLSWLLRTSSSDVAGDARGNRQRSRHRAAE
jgi:hypothetical protein